MYYRQIDVCRVHVKLRGANRYFFYLKNSSSRVVVFSVAARQEINNIKCFTCAVRDYLQIFYMGLVLSTHGTYVRHKEKILYKCKRAHKLTLTSYRGVFDERRMLGYYLYLIL